MKNKFLVTFSILFCLISFSAAPKANALLAGVFTGNFVLVIAGGACMGGGLALDVGANALMENDNRSGEERRHWICGAGIALLIAGVAFGEGDQKKELFEVTPFDLAKDLDQKVKDEIYTLEQRNEILDDYIAFQKAHAEPQRIAFEHADKKTGRELVQELIEKTGGPGKGLKEITARYLIKRVGIQTLAKK